MLAFIETQFPIARLSVEAFKERKAGPGQTLTGLGKWWGRKPLILVRASLLGMLMPASDNPKLDREIFLKILTMDDDGVRERFKGKLNREVFDGLPYAERIQDCERPENGKGPTIKAWLEINAHLGTRANSLSDLVRELGIRRYGHTPRVGDCFCGGGSIPFEAARIGCDTLGSDLNPVAGLLTWASLKLIGGGKAVQDHVRQAQEAIFQAADKQIIDWGIEHNSKGERAEAYLFCTEVKPEGCDYFIPLAPSWVIAERAQQVVATWTRVPGSDRLQPKVMNISKEELSQYKDKKGATVVDSRVIDPFDPARSWSVESLRGPSGLRRWANEDVVPRTVDVFQERLYCIRWIDTDGNRRYAAPDAEDLAREAKVLKLLRERFIDWQREGLVPSMPIPVSGTETDRLFRERGWTHWHHLFTPRQLLTHGLIARNSTTNQQKDVMAASMLNMGRFADWNSRLCCWNSGRDMGAHVFTNQALNTPYNHAVRSLVGLKLAQLVIGEAPQIPGMGIVRVSDARDISENCDLWVTDPPYADAVSYHEIGDFFLAWYEKQISKAFPEWTPDARAELAVRGEGDNFRRSMVEIYRNLANHMPSNGMQMVMFTHQNPSVWADLGMILWASGLKATAAWTISTETEAAGLRKGSYVQGTVCLVLRKRTSNEPGFLDEIYPLVEDEVKHQIASMQALDEGGEPNFNDADYQLAAYAAALKVLTQYGNIDGHDVEHEVFAVRARNEKSDFEAVIERALGIACDYLVPRGLDAPGAWRSLSLVERYYLRALDIESRGERRKGMYEELARGFGVTEIKPLLKSDKANSVRMLTPSGLAASLLAPISGAVAPALLPRRGRNTGIIHPFSATPLRHLMFAIRETASADNNPELGRQYLRDTFGQGYWTQRERLIGLLEWLAQLGNTAGMEVWLQDSDAARILAGRLRNDHA